MPKDTVTVEAQWLIPVPREAVYAIVSDFERLSEHFPKLAHQVRVLSRNGEQLNVEVQAASFGRFFPKVWISMSVTLQPLFGYRCQTFNRTFKTTGKEELLLYDAGSDTRINYIYVVTVKYAWLKPLYELLVRQFALPYWQKAYLIPMTAHAKKLSSQDVQT